MEKSQTQLWANSTTLLDLQNLAKQHLIVLPPKAKKLEIVELLIKNNITRSTKRKVIVGGTDIDNVSPSKKQKASTTSSRRKTVEKLVQKIKQDLKEPTTLTTICKDGIQVFDEDLVVENNQIVGKFLNNKVVFIDKNDVERAIGHRIDYNLLKLVPEVEKVDDINIDDDLSDDCDHDDEDENDE